MESQSHQVGVIIFEHSIGKKNKGKDYEWNRKKRKKKRNLRRKPKSFIYTATTVKAIFNFNLFIIFYIYLKKNNKQKHIEHYWYFTLKSETKNFHTSQRFHNSGKLRIFSLFRRCKQVDPFASVNCEIFHSTEWIQKRKYF